MRTGLFCLLFCIFAICGCASTKIVHLKSNEFQQFYFSKNNLMDKKILIGKTDDRVYLECKKFMSKGQVFGLSKESNYVIYWTELKGLPDQFIQQMEQNKLKKEQRRNEQAK